MRSFRRSSAIFSICRSASSNSASGCNPIRHWNAEIISAFVAPFTAMMKGNRSAPCKIVELGEMPEFFRRQRIESGGSRSRVESSVNSFASASRPARSGCARISASFFVARHGAHDGDERLVIPPRYRNRARAPSGARAAICGVCSKMSPNASRNSARPMREDGSRRLADAS